jgi:hypothetical protein
VRATQTCRSRLVTREPEVNTGTTTGVRLTVFTYTEGLVNCRRRS